MQYTYVRCTKHIIYDIIVIVRYYYTVTRWPCGCACSVFGEREIRDVDRNARAQSTFTYTHARKIYKYYNNII